MKLFDSHAHYNDEKFKQDREEVLQAIFKEGVTKLICAGYSLEASKEAVQIANVHQNIYAIVGISPNDIPEQGLDYEQILSQQLQQIEKLANNEKVVAIGEIGLDYYWNKENKK